MGKLLEFGIFLFLPKFGFRIVIRGFLELLLQSTLIFSIDNIFKNNEPQIFLPGIGSIIVKL